MRNPPRLRDKTALSMKIGGWFEAQASGWGVAAIPVVLAMVLGLAAVRVVWG